MMKPDMPLRTIPWWMVISVLIAVAASAMGALEQPPSTETGAPGASISYLAAIPFTVLVLSHTVLPILPWTRRWYNRLPNRLLMAVVMALAVMLGYPDGPAGAEGPIPSLLTGLYLPLMVTILAFYIIAGNLEVRGMLPPYPFVNTLLLAAGVLLAAVIGTLPASLILIGLVLRTNESRRHIKHTIIFFIYLVGNTAGCLLASGDYALLYGYFQGRPFFQMLNVWPIWLAVNLILLAIYLVLESLLWRSERERSAWQNPPVEAVQCRGWMNLIWLILAVVTVILVPPGGSASLGGRQLPAYSRECILLGLVALSRITTPPTVSALRHGRGLVLLEIAIWLGGLLITAPPMLQVLHQVSGAGFPANPWQVFWAAGVSSSVVDNTAAYMMVTALPVFQPTVSDLWWSAASLGVVFCGAMTYTGNGINYLLKSIAEQAGVPMPGYGKYLVYSAVILLPLWAGLTVVMHWFLGRWGG